VRKLTNDAALNRRPIWTPDGKHCIFTSDNPSAEGNTLSGGSRADGSGRPEKLFADKDSTAGSVYISRRPADRFSPNQ